MSTDYQINRSWADEYVDDQQEVLAPAIGRLGMRKADFYADTRQATDITYFCSNRLNIAARVRRPKYRQSYGLTQFTMRTWLRSGVQTEYSKIVDDGYADWFLYAHAPEDEQFE